MSTNVIQKNQLMQVLQQTPPAAIAELDFVRDKFIQNYNACHREQVGELMYHRQVVHFKQLIVGSSGLKACDPFSLYACFVTAAVNGYSLDPQDDEVYLIPRGGKACLDRQAGAHVKRLIRSGQVQNAEQAKLVYQGDEFIVKNGRVISHMEKYQSEEIIAGYVRFVVDDKGRDLFFIYRRSDWLDWKKKSQMANGENWSGGVNGQPIPAFLRTKIVKHACKEKCWATGSVPVQVEQFDGIEVDGEDVTPPLPGNNSNQINDQGKKEETPADNSFTNEGQPQTNQAAGVTHTDDDF